MTKTTDAIFGDTLAYDLAAAIAGAHAARKYMSKYDMRWSWTNAVVVDRALSRGLHVSATPRRRVRISDDRRTRWFSGGHTDLNDRLADRLTRFKEVTNSLLRSRGLFAPDNAIFEVGDGLRAWRWGQQLAPLVLKPSNSNKGKMVHVGLTDRAEFLEAFDSIAQKHGAALVEQFVPGVEHRVAVVDYQVVAATRRVPANVVGDGVATVSELVSAKNDARRDESNLIHQQLRIDAIAQRELSRQGVHDASVPSEGQRVFLRSTSNIHTGVTRSMPLMIYLRTKWRSSSARRVPSAGFVWQVSMSYCPGTASALSRVCWRSIPA